MLLANPLLIDNRVSLSVSISKESAMPLRYPHHAGGRKSEWCIQPLRTACLVVSGAGAV